MCRTTDPLSAQLYCTNPFIHGLSKKHYASSCSFINVYVYLFQSKLTLRMQIKLQAFCALIATAAFSPDGLSGAAALQTRGGENGVLSEDLQEDMDYDESISMSMSMPNYDTTFDCSALQHLWNTDPTSIEGSDLFLIKEDCDRGLISTAAEVAEAMEAFEGPYQPSIDEQFTTMADKICTHALNETDSEDFEEIQDACEENPRDNEKVVDALARLVAEQTPQEDEGESFYDLYII